MLSSKPMKTNPLTPYFEFIAETAYLAGRLTLGYFQTDIQPDYKADDSPVTLADRQAEELIRSRIEKNFPGHAIVGEEYGDNHQPASCRWIIDPIDGTKAFIRGVPLYAVLIGLEMDGVMQAGAAYFPALDEMLVAALGLGCWWNGRRAHVSPITDIRQAYVSTTSVEAIRKHGRIAQFQRLSRVCYHQIGWSDAYGYLLVATGRVEVMLDPIMNIWDGAPFPPILAEAGGYFGDWEGNVGVFSEALAASQVLLPQVLAILNDGSTDE